MLRKLLRYEFKALLRIMPVLYLALQTLAVAVGVIYRITVGLRAQDGNMPNPLAQGSVILYIVLLFVLFTVNLAVVIQRFRDNFLKDEGYLMFMLPVPEWKLAASKGIAALCTFILTCAAAVLSMLILGLIIAPGQIAEQLPSLMAEVSAIGSARLIMGTLTALAAVFQQLCLVYAALAVSQLAPRFRGLAGFGAYLAVMIFVEYPVSRAVHSLSGIPELPAALFLETAFAVLCLWAVSWLLKHTFNLE